MRESYGEGVASRTGPESCAAVREGVGEALTGVLAGQVLSSIYGIVAALVPVRNGTAITPPLATQVAHNHTQGDRH